MTKTDLFIKLAKPDEQGVSRWVDASEFVGESRKSIFKNDQ